MAEPKHVFENETKVLNAAKEILSKKNLETEELWNEYQNLLKQYDYLLGDSKVITNISDRLQNKLNAANENLKAKSDEIRSINETLESKNIELQSTIDELTRAKISRKATTITLIVAVILFIISEGFLEPLIERSTLKLGFSNNVSFWLGFSIKGFIALMLKPIDYLVESFLKREARRKSKVGNPVLGAKS